MKLERDGVYLCQRTASVEQWTCMGKIPGETTYLCFCVNGNGSRFFREFTETGEQLMNGGERIGGPRQLLKELPKKKIKKEGWIVIAILPRWANSLTRGCSIVYMQRSGAEDVANRMEEPSAWAVVKVEWEEDEQ